MVAGHIVFVWAQIPVVDFLLQQLTFVPRFWIVVWMVFNMMYSRDWLFASADLITKSYFVHYLIFFIFLNYLIPHSISSIQIFLLILSGFFIDNLDEFVYGLRVLLKCLRIFNFVNLRLWYLQVKFK